MKQSELPDLLVLGAGPAGAAAAALAADAGLSVVVVEQRGTTEPLPGVDWLNKAGCDLLEKVGCDIREDRVGSIRLVRFADPANGRVVEARLEKPVDLIQVDALSNRLLEQAVKKGATVQRAARGRRIEAAEDRVTLVVDDQRRFAARLMISAEGSGSVVPREGRLANDPDMAAVSRCVEWLETHNGPPGPKKIEGCLTLLVNQRDPTTYGYLLDASEVSTRGVVAQQDEPRIWRTFGEHLAAAVRHGWLPSAPSISAAPIRLVPRGLALDMETHVGKRRLVIGDAGGFVSAISQDGLYPALESARLAIEVCARALKAAHPQDVLAEFDTLWRAKLADYLRMPNTDLRFLMPLVFTNQQMAGKLARAFVLGENI